MFSQPASYAFFRTCFLNSTRCSGFNAIKKSAVSQWTRALSLNSKARSSPIALADWMLSTPPSNRPLYFCFNLSVLMSGSANKWKCTFACLNAYSHWRSPQSWLLIPSSPSTVVLKSIVFPGLDNCSIIDFGSGLFISSTTIGFPSGPTSSIFGSSPSLTPVIYSLILFTLSKGKLYSVMSSSF